MRAIIALALLCAPVVAHADSYVELAGGISIPAGDDDYTNNVETSPVLALRAGAFPKELGLFFGAEWAPMNTDYENNQFADVSAHRFRLMAGGIIHHNISNLLAFSARGGIGADIAYVNIDSVVGDQSDTDVGLGFEFAGGLWAKVGGLEVGGELAIPISTHDDDNPGDFIPLDYTAYDVQLLFAVRFVSRSGGGD
ncbi:MAG TPA: hypothetical protein VFV99_10020 [Kofleriaceae bacterium]|nr:hypothetical protein [Kofleriaceae bacterium]